MDALEGGGSGLTDAVKTALMNIVNHIGVWTDENAQAYIDALNDALYPVAPPASLTSITAVYTQNGTVYDTDALNSLKSDLVVTAHYSDGTTETITIYALSGTLAAGTSTVTVTYNGKTTTFTVTVTTEVKMIDGYHASNNQNVSSCGPYALHYNSVYAYDHTKPVTSIELNVTTAGKLTLLVTPLTSFSGNAISDDWANLVIKDTLFIENTGFQKVRLNTPFVIPTDYVLVIGGGPNASKILQDPDTCIWKYGSYGSQKGFGYKGSSSNKSLGINVYVGDSI